MTNNIYEQIEMICENDSIVYPILILDTNILLDYVEDRDLTVKEYIKKNLVPLQGKGSITIGTTIYNIAELLDKDFEINFQLSLIKKKNTADKRISIVRNRQEREKHIQELDDGLKKIIKSTPGHNVKKILGIFTLFYGTNLTNQDCKFLQDLILEGTLNSQDAMIVLVVYKYGDYTYFLTKDSGIINSKLASDSIDIFNMKDERYRKQLLERLETDIEYLKGE